MRRIKRFDRIEKAGGVKLNGRHRAGILREIQGLTDATKEEVLEIAYNFCGHPEGYDGTCFCKFMLEVWEETNRSSDH